MVNAVPLQMDFCMNAPKKILVVDDSPVWVERLTAILKEIKNIGNISYAVTYNEAIEKMHAVKADIVLLDISLPDKNGIDLIKVFRNEYPDTMVVMVTNFADEFYRKLSKKLGANYFIDKSNEFEQIAEIIEQGSKGLKIKEVKNHLDRDAS